MIMHSALREAMTEPLDFVRSLNSYTMPTEKERAAPLSCTQMAVLMRTVRVEAHRPRHGARVFAFLLTLLSFCGAGYGMQRSKLVDLYAKGEYPAAMVAGEAQDDADGLATAARAALADANLRDVPCLSCLQHAEALARRAIAKDPSQTESHVYLAVALGYEARIVGVLHARFAHYPEDAKQALDESLAANPNDVWTLASLGGWNIEVVHSGGSLLAKMQYGATLKTGIDYYKRAFAADPGNMIVRFQYALSLSSVAIDTQRAEIAAELKAAAESRPQNAYESAVKLRAGKLFDLLARDRKAYLALVAQYQGYP
jgi:hypothetical protein